MKKLYQLLLRLMELLAMITLAGMVIIVFWSVLSRFVLTVPSHGQRRLPGF